MNHQRLQAQRDYLAGKIVVGVDPAKDKHQAAAGVLSPQPGLRRRSRLALEHASLSTHYEHGVFTH
jgi:hypothetical protein